MMLRDAGLIDEPLLQEAAEAGRMCFWNADVLIQVEHLHARPVNTGKAGEHFAKRKLRGAGGGDNARLPVFLDSFSEDGSGLFRRYFCHLLLIFKAFDLHVMYDLAIRISLELLWCSE